MRLHILSVITSARGWQLEGLNGEGEVCVIRVIHQESVINGLLDTFCLITRRNEGAGFTGSITLLYPGSLCESLIVSLDPIDHNSPFSSRVKSS